jgi:hypothetical protein
MAYDDVRLRLESPDSLAAREYRLHDGRVETRRQEAEMAYAPESYWQQLTPQQLSDHVRHSTVVSYWLQCRVGWRRLLQMCVAEDPYEWTATHVEEHADLQAV